MLEHSKQELREFFNLSFGQKLLTWIGYLINILATITVVRIVLGFFKWEFISKLIC